MSNESNWTPAPGSSQYEYQVEHWNEDERPAQYAAVIICAVAPTVAIALRLYTHHRYRHKFALDDLFAIIALIIVYAEMIGSCLALHGGAGLHQVRVMESNPAPEGLLYVYINYFIVSVLWGPGVTFVKLSILLLYKRLFLVGQRWFKWALILNALYAIGLGIASTFVFIYQCSPPDYYWKRYLAYYGEEAPNGSCLPQLAHLVTPQALSTASDLVILVLPIPILWKLKTPLARRLALIGLFTLGMFTVGMGIARIVVITRVSNTSDITWNNIDTVTFTVVEAGVGIVCACGPPIAPLYNDLMKRWKLLPPSFFSTGSSLRKHTKLRTTSAATGTGKTNGCSRAGLGLGQKIRKLITGSGHSEHSSNEGILDKPLEETPMQGSEFSQGRSESQL